jgi:hypothetical protein
MGEEPEEEGEDDADDQAGDDGKVESGVFATVNDVAGEAAETEGEAGAEEKESANNGDDGAED